MEHRTCIVTASHEALESVGADLWDVTGATGEVLRSYCSGYYEIEFVFPDDDEDITFKYDLPSWFVEILD